MTTGQRISEKRKELGLSQEALGEKLGVSRQSIYKWESDASLPDVDKLIALGRLFGVPVGWLLGVEEISPPSPADDETAPPQPDWGERQEQLVEEVLRRYQAAQPRPPKRRRWPYVAVALAITIAGYSLFNRLDTLDNNYNNLQNSVYSLNRDVNSQIQGITNQVEEILKSQNDLTADYSTQLLGADLANNTVTFSCRVVPKTYVEGMEVYFLAEAGSGPTQIMGEAGAGQAFTGEITCELTDDITLSAVFVTGETRQTQLLDSYGGLYGGSMPWVDLLGGESAFLHEDIGEDGLFHLNQDQREFIWINNISTDTKFGAVDIDSVKVGLFKNYQLLQWLELSEKPTNWNVNSDDFFAIPKLDLALEKGDILHFAAVYTDEYGRTGVAPSIPVFECFGDRISWTSSSDGTPYSVISNYNFDPIS